MRRPPILLISAVVSGLLAAPGIASACPSLRGAKTFAGTFDLSFSGTGTASGVYGGTQVMTLEDHADGLKVEVTRPPLTSTPKPSVSLLDKLPPKQRQKVEALLKARPVQYIGKTGGGVVVINDTYSYPDAGGTTITSTQRAAGPELATSGITNLFELAAVRINQGACTYQLQVAYAVDTQSAGLWPSPPDTGVSGIAFSPVEHLPSSLKLHGSASLPIRDVCSAKGAKLNRGCGEMGALWGAGSWWDQFEGISGCGSPGAPVVCPSEPLRFDWKLSPKR